MQVNRGLIRPALLLKKIVSTCPLPLPGLSGPCGRGPLGGYPLKKKIHKTLDRPSRQKNEGCGAPQQGGGVSPACPPEIKMNVLTDKLSQT